MLLINFKWNVAQNRFYFVINLNYEIQTCATFARYRLTDRMVNDVYELTSDSRITGIDEWHFKLHRIWMTLSSHKRPTTRYFKKYYLIIFVCCLLGFCGYECLSVRLKISFSYKSYNLNIIYWLIHSGNTVGTEHKVNVPG